MNAKNSRQLAPGGGSGNSAGALYVHPYSTPAAAGSQVYSQQGRVVGRITPDGVYVKRLDPARHKLRQPSGWAIDAEHLSLDWRSVRIETTSGETWTASKDAFLAHGVRLNRGFGEQVCLPDAFWSVRRAGEPQQLELFGVTP